MKAKIRTEEDRLSREELALVEQIYERNRRFVERVVCRFLNSDWREDAIQETWVRVLSSKSIPSGEKHLRPWLYVLAKCEVAKVLKAHYKFHPRDSRGRQRTTESHEQNIIHADQWKRLCKLLRRLPSAQREAIEGRLRGVPVSRMAQQLGLSEGAIWERINRGYRNLRTWGHR